MAGSPEQSRQAEHLGGTASQAFKRKLPWRQANHCPVSMSTLAPAAFGEWRRSGEASLFEHRAKDRFGMLPNTVRTYVILALFQLLACE